VGEEDVIEAEDWCYLWGGGWRRSPPRGLPAGEDPRLVGLPSRRQRGFALVLRCGGGVRREPSPNPPSFFSPSPSVAAADDRKETGPNDL